MIGPVKRVAVAVVAIGLIAGPAWAAGGGGGSSSSAQTQDSGYAKARTLIQAANYGAAIPLLEKVVAADPRNADAFNLLGYAHRKLGDKETALTYYQKALAIAPEHRGANEYLGELYLELGQLDKARERLSVLDRACFFGCEEYRELKAAIETYQAKAGG